MELKELQDLLHKEQGKIIIVENGEPLMVIIPYEEYKKRQSNGVPAENFENEAVPPLQEGNGDVNGDQDELTVDDLPL